MDFYEKVYDLVKQIPYGRVSTYGAIASFLGSKGSARMVGWALNQSHQMADVPAHRVVNRNGVLSGKHHFSKNNPMHALLLAEGILVENDAIVNFDLHFWDPNELLK